jgi:methyl-accepting chemotaxis protein
MAWVADVRQLGHGFVGRAIAGAGDRLGGPKDLSAVAAALGRVCSVIESIALRAPEAKVAPLQKAAEAMWLATSSTDAAQDLEQVGTLQANELRHMAAGHAWARQVMAIGAGLALMLSVALALLIGRSITRPLSAIVGVMRRLAAGDKAVEIPGQSRRDEPRDVAIAVVASEVKALAQQTAKATEEIGTQIGDIQTATREGVVAIQGIVRTIEEVGTIAAAIAAAVKQQGAATAQIASNVQQTAEATREVTAAISGVSAASDETSGAAGLVNTAAADLSRQAERLRRQVAEFLGEICPRDEPAAA